MANTPTRILIAEPEDIARKGLRVLLEAESDFEIVGEVSGGGEAIDQVRLHRPDIALISVSSQNVSGLQAAYQIKQNWPEVAVIILSMMEDLHVLLRAIEVGVDGYLLKTTPRAALVEAIRITAAGGAAISPRLLRLLLGYLTQLPLLNRQLTSTLSREESLLTLREREVARLLSYGLSNRQIANYLGIGESTVKTHMQRIFRKLGISDRTQAAIRLLGAHRFCDKPPAE